MTVSIFNSDVSENASNIVLIKTGSDGKSTATSQADGSVIAVNTGKLDYFGVDQNGHVFVRGAWSGGLAEENLSLVFDSAGGLSIELYGNPLFSLNPGSKVLIDEQGLSTSLHQGGLTSNMILSSGEVKMAVSNTDGTFKVSYNADLIDSTGTFKWTQNGSTYAGGDLGSFIAGYLQSRHVGAKHHRNANCQHRNYG